MARNGSHDLETLRDDVMQLQADLKTLMGRVVDIGDDVTRVVGGLPAQAKGVVHEFEKTAGKIYKNASRDAGGYVKTVEKSITDHPFSAAAIALAAGLILSRFLDRDR